MRKRSKGSLSEGTLDGLEGIPEKSAFARKIAALEKLSETAVFVRNPLADDSAKQRQRDNEELLRGYNRNLTSEFFRFLFWKISHRENIDLSFYGVPRGGKTGSATSVALDIASLSGIPFPLDSSQIFRNQSEFLRATPTAKSGGVYVIDEQRRRHTQIGSWAEEQELEDISNICAKRMIHKLWVCPILIPRGSELALKVVALDRRLALAKAIIYDLDDDGSGLPFPQGFTVIRHYDPSVSTIQPEALIKLPPKSLTPMQLLRANYEKRKDAGIDRLLERASSESVLFRLEDAKALSRDPLFQKCDNIMERKVIARLAFPEGYVEEAIEEIVRLASNKKGLLDDLLERERSRSKAKITAKAAKTLNTKSGDIPE